MGNLYGHKKTTKESVCMKIQRAKFSAFVGDVRTKEYSVSLVNVVRSTACD